MQLNVPPDLETLINKRLLVDGRLVVGVLERLVSLAELFELVSRNLVSHERGSVGITDGRLAFLGPMSVKAKSLSRGMNFPSLVLRRTGCAAKGRQGKSVNTFNSACEDAPRPGHYVRTTPPNRPFCSLFLDN